MFYKTSSCKRLISAGFWTVKLNVICMTFETSGFEFTSVEIFKWSQFGIHFSWFLSENCKLCCFIQFLCKKGDYGYFKAKNTFQKLNKRLYSNDYSWKCLILNVCKTSLETPALTHKKQGLHSHRSRNIKTLQKFRESRPRFLPPKSEKSDFCDKISVLKKKSKNSMKNTRKVVKIWTFFFSVLWASFLLPFAENILEPIYRTIH